MADPRANKLSPEPLVATDGDEVTKSDAVDLDNVGRCLYIGGDGDIRVTTRDGSVLNFVGVKAGTILPVSCLKVWSTGTSATNIVNLW